MARFRQEPTTADDHLNALVSATEQFKSSVERQAADVIEAAEARASEIERDAARKAEEIEREAEREVEREASALEGLLEKRSRLASQMLESVERLERSVHEAVSAFRTELESVQPPERAENPTNIEGTPEEAAAAGLVSPGSMNAPAPPQVMESLRNQIQSVLENSESRKRGEDLMMRLEVGEDAVASDETRASEEEDPSSRRSRRRELRRRRRAK